MRRRAVSQSVAARGCAQFSPDPPFVSAFAHRVSSVAPKSRACLVRGLLLLQAATNDIRRESTRGRKRLLRVAGEQLPLSLEGGRRDAGFLFRTHAAGRKQTLRAVAAAERRRVGRVGVGQSGRVCGANWARLDYF